MERVGYLGPIGSYSYGAAKDFFPDALYLAYESFPLVMNSLICGETDYIVLPIENSLNGGVLQNLDLLKNTENIVAVKEAIVAIDHRLVYLKEAEKSGIEVIYSHEQALQQCEKYLTKNFPNARLVSCASTAASLDLVKNKNEACIVGVHLKREGFTFSTENIADEPNNFTHFLLVMRGGIPNGFQSKKIFFTFTCPNVSGALVNILNKLRDYGINMTKIESRPIKNKPDEYSFFLEIEGDYSSERIKLALKDIKKLSSAFKLLGCY